MVVGDRTRTQYVQDVLGCLECAMAVKKGKPVRPILVDGIMGKRFKRHESIAKRSIAASIATHPSIVAHEPSR